MTTDRSVNRATRGNKEADPLLASLDIVKNKQVVWLEAGDDLTQAFSAASPLSIPFAATGVTERLAEIVK